MFAMSVKLVPVWSVTMPPSGIGVPVAATPGFVPHEEVLTAAAELEPELDGEELEPPPAALELELELELLHPASTPSAITATAAPATRERRRENLFMSSAFSWPKRIFPNERWRCL
jgi:hypothetical protein